MEHSQNTGPAGAAPEDWQAFVDLGLAADLLPVVSDPTIPLSPNSSISEGSRGKVPSKVKANGAGPVVVGIPGWQDHQASDRHIANWSQNSAHGICVIARRVRAIDIDLSDPAKVDGVIAITQQYLAELGQPPAPVRCRANSPRKLLMLNVTGNLPKASLPVGDERIEFLATGQMFVAAGRHRSGARYEWQGGLPTTIPTLTQDQLAELFQRIATAVDSDWLDGRVRDRPAGDHLDVADPVADFLSANGLVRRERQDGHLLDVHCPWADQHTDGVDNVGDASYIVAGTNGSTLGGFKCLHDHCAGRGYNDFVEAIGFVDPSVIEDFDDLPAEDLEEDEEDGGKRTVVDSIKHRISHPRTAESTYEQEFIYADLIPAGMAGMISSDGGTGKTTFLIALAVHRALGLDFLERPTKPGMTIFISQDDGQDQLDKAIDLIVAALGYELGGPEHLQVLRRVILVSLRDEDDIKGPKTFTSTKTREPTKLAEMLIKGLRDIIEPDTMFVLDTMRHFLGGSSIDDDVGGNLMAGAGRIATRLGATVVIPHHLNKSASGSATLTAMSSTGSNAIVNTARFAITVRRARRHNDNTPERKNWEPLFLVNSLDGVDTDPFFDFTAETVLVLESQRGSLLAKVGYPIITIRRGYRFFAGEMMDADDSEYQKLIRNTEVNLLRTYVAEIDKGVVTVRGLRKSIKRSNQNISDDLKMFKERKWLTQDDHSHYMVTDEGRKISRGHDGDTVGTQQVSTADSADGSDQGDRDG